jgi:DMSO/TMAO reductase YedYZ molybdopterin-dependent catalytic subunit
MALITLTIDGEIDLPRGFTFDELRRAPEQILECGALFGRPDVKAISLAALVEPLRVQPWARFAVVRGTDGFVANVPVAGLYKCLLIYALGELPLRADLGGPVRLFAPGLGRCSNVKGVTSVSLAIAATRREQSCAHAHRQRNAPISALIGDKTPT